MGEKKPIEINDTSFEEEVINSQLPVLVDFWAPWCGACRMAGPIVDKIADQYQGRLKVCKLNVDDGPQTSAKYAVMSIPAFNLFKSGKVVDQIVGVTPDFESDIKAKIDSCLKQK